MGQQGEDDDVAILREIRAMLESCGPVDVENVDEMNAMRLRMREHRERLAALRGHGSLREDREGVFEFKLAELTKRVERLEARR
ncbi:MAG: hypothetical protein FJX45_07510 [Alphaproteobacteria bacterium]|nr:hypothetical protein [Alphaproteobacteria bacterium]MBM3654807.1 hypothetical protein [Alphaproteobacteria bacterium]